MGGKRFDSEPKLNMKKVFGVIIGFAVVIMFIITLSKLLDDSSKTPKITEASTHYFPVYTNEKWGVINSSGNVIIEPKYDEMILIPNNSTPIFLCTYDVDYTNNTYKTKAINEKSQEILKGYDNIWAISNKNSNGQTWYEDNVFKVIKDGKYGVIDGKGKEIVKCNYNAIVGLQGAKDCIVIEKDGKVGLCDIYGNTILNTEFKEIKAISEDNKKEFIVKGENDKYGIASSDKTLIIEPNYEDIAQISAKDLYVVKEEGKWKVINADKSINIADKFDEVKEINDTNIVIKKDGKYGVINTQGEEKIPAEYESLTHASDNCYIAKKDGKFGIIDIEKNTKLAFNYSNLYYRKGADLYIADKEDTESDIINSNFEVKLTGVLAEINIEKGYMRIRIDGDYKYYNFKFEEKKAPEILTKNTIFLDKKDGKYGYINNKGEVVVEYQYDDATEQNEYGFASVNKEGKWGSLDKDGKVVVAPEKDLQNNQIINFIGKWHLGADASANYYTDI